MDPWYCFNFEYNLKDEEDNSFDLCEISEMYPDGSWEINSSEYGSINFKNKEYFIIEFNNDTKHLICKNGDIIDIYKLNIELISI